MKIVNKWIEAGLISLIMAPGAVFAQDSDKAEEMQAEANIAQADTNVAQADANTAQADTNAAQADANAAESSNASASTATGTDGTTTTEKTSTLPDPEMLTEQTLNKTLHEVSTNVDTLKEDTFTTKSRLLLLREEVLQRSVSGARLLIRHKDDMGNQFEMIEIRYSIDNKLAFSQIANEDGVIDGIDDSIVFDENTSPGTHQVSVKYVYRGKKWGVFEYMHHYSFVVESGYSFVLEEGKSAELTITAAEKGDAFTAYEERPTVEYAFEQYNLAADSAAAKAAETK